MQGRKKSKRPSETAGIKERILLFVAPMKLSHCLLEAAARATFLLVLKIYISTMPCWLGLFPPSPISPSLSSVSPILRHGAFFYLLWFLWGTICAHFDKGCGADSEHMETDTKSNKHLPLHDLDRNDSESDILSYDIFIFMWSHPLEVG